MVETAISIWSDGFMVMLFSIPIPEKLVPQSFEKLGSF
jgi:hypothetical protein